MPLLEGISDMVGHPAPPSLNSFTSIREQLDISEAAPTGPRQVVWSFPVVLLLHPLGLRIWEPGPLATVCWTRLSISDHGYDRETQPMGQGSWRTRWCWQSGAGRENITYGQREVLPAPGVPEISPWGNKMVGSSRRWLIPQGVMADRPVFDCQLWSDDLQQIWAPAFSYIK